MTIRLLRWPLLLSPADLGPGQVLEVPITLGLALVGSGVAVVVERPASERPALQVFRMVSAGRGSR